MSKKSNIVAELGRPETPAETAARKAQTSRLYRERKTVNNLVFSLLVTVGLVAVIFLLVPRGTGDTEGYSVDVAQEATHAGADRPLIVPEAPEGWKAKQAKLTSEGSIAVWQIHYTTADNAYVSVVQAYTRDGAPVPAKWIAAMLEEQEPTGNESLGGLEWTVYEHLNRKPDQVNMRFGLETVAGDETVLVFGTDSDATIRVFATGVADEITLAHSLQGNAS